jgi:putative MATE family efflux protein
MFRPNEAALMSFPPNAFIRDPIPRVLLRTALPIILLTSVNGLLTVVDAMLLGAFVGPEALAAVTLVFPVSMALIALATMVSSGMASILARQLGGGQIDKAQASFAGAHGLAALLCLLLAIIFALGGRPLVAALTTDADLAGMSFQFLAISILAAPLALVGSIHSDALRVEGRIGFMALAGLAVTLGNIAFNLLLIAGLGLGVAGSALGTALAQALALALMIAFRLKGQAILSLRLRLQNIATSWREMLALGAPRSLSFLGIALGAAATIAAVRLHVGGRQDVVIAAYGAITRMMTFTYLPLLGLSLGMQAVVGNNHGAGLTDRSRLAFRLAAGTALVYCAVVQVLLFLLRGNLGYLFVADPRVVAEVARILPFYAALYLTLGPMMMVASYLQSIGDARRSAFLSLARTYLFAVPLTFTLPLAVGEYGIWIALPLADLLLLLTTLITLRNIAPSPATA